MAVDGGKVAPLGLWLPATNILQVLLTDATSWMYLAVTAGAATLTELANLLVAYAALG